ncbi:MAG: hypothetical protein ACFFDR_02065, partial [Candidatus Thorarchaeota archaeon]
MTGKAVVKEIAPKRKRMMDMILVLGGLKEEAAIPLSKVNEEVAHLRKDIEPLVTKILRFPDVYFQGFHEAAQKTGISNQISDKGILTEGISNLDRALEYATSTGLTGLRDSLKAALDAMTTKDQPTETVSIDIDKILTDLPSTASKILAVIDGFEEASKLEQAKAKEELDSLTEAFNEIITDTTADADGQLDKLQKLGTKTRYGPFLRVAAQLKRAKREDRVNDERFETLVSKNLVVELQRGIIMFVLDKMGSKTAVQISDLTGLAAQDIQGAIISMISRGDVEMVGLDGDAPVFARVIGKAPDSTLVLKRVIQQLRGVLKTLEGSSKKTVEESLKVLETAYNRLQILGEYDEPTMADPMKALSDIGEKAAEAAIGSQAGEDSDDLRLLVSAGLEAFARFRLKIALEKGHYLVSGVNVYGEKLD